MNNRKFRFGTLLVFLAAMTCTVVSASAQQTRNEQDLLKQMQGKIKQVEKWNRYANTFSEQLDSVYGDFQKSVFGYDERFNCVNIDYYWFYDDWMYDYTEKYAYDERDRITMIMDSTEGHASKSVFLYENGEWISDEYEYELDGDEWIAIGKYTYEYDSDGHMVLSVGYALEEDWVPENKMTWEYEDGKLLNDIYYYHGENSWNPLTRNDYYYNAEGLCRERLQSHWEGDWTESWKVEYEYDEAGNRHTETTSTIYELDDWVYTYMTEYFYDANGNCYSSASYYNDDLRDWELESTMTYNYDFSVQVETVAGIWMVWDDELPIHNKLLNWQLRANDDAYTTTFYYSECEGLNEKPGSSLTVYPNPAREKITIDGAEVTEVQIYNALGQLVKTVRDTNEISVTGLAEGVYLVRIMDVEEALHTKRITVTR